MDEKSKLETKQNIHEIMTDVGKAAKKALTELAVVNTDKKNQALKESAKAIRNAKEFLKEANSIDLKEARQKGMSGSMLDRLLLDESRIEAMAKGLDDIANLEDPVGTVLAEWERPNGLHIQRVCVPLGVIGIIYESRPNVTADAGGLSLKSGNTAILRGGSESFNSSKS